jgi:hypothetical protein
VGRSIAARRGGDLLRVGRREEGGGSDGWGPLGSDVREETSLTDSTNSKKRRLLANTPRLLRPSGPSARTTACGRSGRGCSGLGRMGRNRRKNYFQIKFEFLNIQRLWKFAQGDLGGILT